MNRRVFPFPPPCLRRELLDTSYISNNNAPTHITWLGWVPPIQNVKRRKKTSNYNVYDWIVLNVIIIVSETPIWTERGGGGEAKCITSEDC